MIEGDFGDFLPTDHPGEFFNPGTIFRQWNNSRKCPAVCHILEYPELIFCVFGKPLI